MRVIHHPNPWDDWVAFMAMSNADRQREYRRRKGARVGQPPGPLPFAEHGTVSAYKRHLRHQQPPCKPCKAAWAEYHRKRG